MDDPVEQERRYLRSIQRLLNLAVFLLVIILIQFLFLVFGVPHLPKKRAVWRDAPTTEAEQKKIPAFFSGEVWKAPILSDSVHLKNLNQLKYGEELIKNTSLYFGPKGKIRAISNGMNCQNCHLQAGTAPFGNNYGAVFATYPKYRARSGTVEDLDKRVDDCFERSLNGRAPAKQSIEKKAIVAYIEWLGKQVEKGKKPPGSGMAELTYLDRAASPEKGQRLYMQKCTSCHGDDGQGRFNELGTAYLYPPLWGDHSFNDGAGLNRISRMAGFLKTNMPLGATYTNPLLTDTEAWDIAAFLISKPRPHKNQNSDWPNRAEKPIDLALPPFSDHGSMDQHKYGPFVPISSDK